MDKFVFDDLSVCLSDRLLLQINACVLIRFKIIDELNAALERAAANIQKLVMRLESHSLEKLKLIRLQGCPVADGPHKIL